MSSFVPSKSHLRHSLLFLFHQKKKAVEVHRLLVKTYGEHAPVIRACETWFRQFISGDFDLTDNEHPGDPRSNLPTFKSNGKNPKVWKMGTTPTER